MRKSKVELWYKRPARIDPDAELMVKNYEYYTSALSTAIDAALRLALDGYYVQVLIDGHVVFTWEENFIRDIYHY